MKKNVIIEYLARLVNDSNVTREDMVDEVLDIIDECNDSGDSSEVSTIPLSFAFMLKVIQEDPEEKTVPDSVMATICVLNKLDLSREMQEELRAYALCGFRRGLEEMDIPPVYRMSTDDYINELTMELTSFHLLSKDMRPYFIQALTDGYKIATSYESTIFSHIVYLLTNGFNPDVQKKVIHKMKESGIFYDFINE